MPPLKSSLIKPSKSMLFFHIWNANFSVTPINSQMYMTKPKQVQKNLRKYWEIFFRNYALFYMQGVGIFTEITVLYIFDMNENSQTIKATSVYDDNGLIFSGKKFLWTLSLWEMWAVIWASPKQLQTCAVQ